MTPQEKFIKSVKELEKSYETYQKQREELEAIMKEIGVDQYIQDPETLVVYKTIVPNGTFVSFRPIDYKRTALPGERGGTVLSKKEAEEAGFVLSK